MVLCVLFFVNSRSGCCRGLGVAGGCCAGLFAGRQHHVAGRLWRAWPVLYVVGWQRLVWCGRRREVSEHDEMMSPDEMVSRWSDEMPSALRTSLEELKILLIAHHLLVIFNLFRWTYVDVWYWYFVCSHVFEPSNLIVGIKIEISKINRSQNFNEVFCQ